MNKLQGKDRIIDLIMRRNQIEKMDLIMSLNSLRVSYSEIEKSIDSNIQEFQGLMQTVACTMGNNQLLDPLLWHERMQYAQELQHIRKRLLDKANLLGSEIKNLERKVEILTAKEKSLEQKKLSVKKEIVLGRLKIEENALSDLYATHPARSS